MVEIDVYGNIFVKGMDKTLEFYEINELLYPDSSSSNQIFLGIYNFIGMAQFSLFSLISCALNLVKAIVKTVM